MWKVKVLNVSLTPELEAIVQTKVASGHYTSASEVVGEALRLMADRDALESICRDDIRLKISQGMASLKSGKSRDGEAVFNAIEDEMSALDRLAMK
jgi:antitoxin ParD1/3/4